VERVGGGGRMFYPYFPLDRIWIGDDRGVLATLVTCILFSILASVCVLIRCCRVWGQRGGGVPFCELTLFAPPLELGEALFPPQPK